MKKLIILLSALFFLAASGWGQTANYNLLNVTKLFQFIPPGGTTFDIGIDGSSKTYIGTVGTGPLLFKIKGIRAGFIDSTLQTISWGWNSLPNNAGVQNTGIGATALEANVSGHGNTAVGYNAMFSNYSGIENTAVGRGALGPLFNGNYNIAVGREANGNAITANTGENYTIAIGYNNLALSDSSIVIGQSIADSIGAAAVGNNLIANTRNGFVCGTWNDTTIQAIFAVGNGTDAAHTHTAFGVDNAGDVIVNGGTLYANGGIDVASVNSGGQIKVTNSNLYVQTVGNGIILVDATGVCWLEVPTPGTGVMTGTVVTCPP